METVDDSKILRGPDRIFHYTFSNSNFYFLFFIFCNAADLTQSLTHASQVLHD
jgi:hypothetical protein